MIESEVSFYWKKYCWFVDRNLFKRIDRKFKISCLFLQITIPWYRSRKFVPSNSSNSKSELQIQIKHVGFKYTYTCTTIFENFEPLGCVVNILEIFGSHCMWSQRNLCSGLVVLMVWIVLVSRRVSVALTWKFLFFRVFIPSSKFRKRINSGGW